MKSDWWVLVKSKDHKSFRITFYILLSVDLLICLFDFVCCLLIYYICLAKGTYFWFYVVKLSVTGGRKTIHTCWISIIKFRVRDCYIKRLYLFISLHLLIPKRLPEQTKIDVPLYISRPYFLRSSPSYKVTDIIPGSFIGRNLKEK